MSLKNFAARCSFATARAVPVALMLLAGTSALPALAQQAVYPVAVDNEAADPLLTNLAIPANAAQAGMWSNVFNWPIISIHASLLPDGRVLTFGAPPGGTVQDGRTLVFWDPRKGTGSSSLQVLPNAQNVDSFCASATLMSDGKLLTSGGATYASGFSSRESMVMDWRTSSATRDYDLTAPRWYATMTKLPDGRAVITGGGSPYANGDPNRADAAPDVSSTPEIYTPGQGWRSLVGAYSTDAFGAKNTRWWYPRQWVSPAGTLFGISTEKVWEMRLEGNGSIRTLRNFKTAADANTRPNVGPTSTAVMYDTGKILQMGGNGYFNGYNTPSSAAASIFDITNIGSGAVTVTEAAPMANPRQWGHSVVLPDGKVLVSGGSRYADQAGANSVLATEIWNPATNRWTTGASNNLYRGYHATALLLPNGAVFTGGGGAPGPLNNLNGEIYYPPYLFRQEGGRSVLAARPRIVSLSTISTNYGQNVDVQTADGDNITEVSLIAAGSVTHSFDSNQRRMKLAFTRNANGISVAIPGSANLAPPGYYMLSTVNAGGVPSKGIIISIAAAAPAAPAAPNVTPPPTPTPTPTPAPEPPAPPAATGNGVEIGHSALTLSAGADGTVGTINTANEFWVLRPGMPWTNMPGKYVDVAVIGANRYYALGTDKRVYRWDGNNWNIVGGDSKAIAAGTDGTVAVVNSNNGSVWVKNADDNVASWRQAPGVIAKKVAVYKRGSLYFIGMDNNVYRSDMVNRPVLVGRNGFEITASPQAGITVVVSDGSMWRKTSDDNVERWSNVPGRAVLVATPNANTLVYTNANKAIMRR